MAPRGAQVTSLTITEDRFGVLEDEQTGERQAVRRFSLNGGRGLSFQVVTFGAAVTSLSVPDRHGVVEDVLLGFDSLRDYVEHSELSLGGVMGRVSGRVAGASFRLGQDIHYLTENVAPHHRDGGHAAFHKALWEAKMLEDGVLLSHVSADGAGGFPGAVLAEVSFRLPSYTVLPELWVDMTAVATAPTPLDMSLALPFNLAGHDAGEPALKEHQLTLDADQYLATTREFIPTGQRWHVGGTCLDLRRPVWLGQVMERTHLQGMEHTFCLTPMPEHQGERLVGRLEHPASGRAVEIRSDHCAARVYSLWDLSPPWAVEEAEDAGDDVDRTEPAPEGHFYKENRPSLEELFPGYVDLYATPDESEAQEAQAEGAGDATGAEEQPECVEEEVKAPAPASDISCRVSAATLPGLCGKAGSSYYKNGAIMVTPQGYPNAVNKKNFPCCILMPGETYRRRLTYRFFSGAEGVCTCDPIY